MASTALKHHIEMLEKADTNDERLQAVLKIQDYCKEEGISKDSEIGLETFESIGSNFAMLLDPTTVIEGEEAYLVRSTLIDVLFYFVQYESLTVHTKMFDFLPLIGKIITLCNDADNDTCIETVEKCYGILECIAQHSDGLDAIINSSTVVYLCSAAGAFKVGHKDAEWLLVCIAAMRGERMWSGINIGVLNSLFLTYTESIDNADNDDDNRKWQIMETMNILLGSMNRTCSDQYIPWSRKLQNVILKILCCKLSRKNRDIAMNLAFKLTYIYGVEFVFEADRKLIIQLVRLASVYISMALSTDNYKQVSMTADLIYYCNFLRDIMRKCDEPLIMTQICVMTRATIIDLCNMFICEGKKDARHNDIQHETSSLDRNSSTQSKENKNSKIIVQEQEHSKTEHDSKHARILAQKSQPRAEYSSVDSVLSGEQVSSPTVPRVMLHFANVVVLWWRCSMNRPNVDTQEACSKVMDTQRYLLQLLEKVIEGYEASYKASEIDGNVMAKTTLLYGVLFFRNLVSRNMVDGCIRKEHLPKLLGNCVLTTWADFKKTHRILSSQSLTSGPVQSRPRPDASNLKISFLFDFEKLALSTTIGIMATHILPQTVLYVTSDEMKIRLHKFAITNLPYLETNKDLVEMAYGVMALGLKLCTLLLEVNKLPAGDISLFFETSLILLDEHVKVQKQGKVTKLILHYHLGRSNYTHLWAPSIRELSYCIPVIPSVIDCILRVEWISDILEKLQGVKAKHLQQEIRDGFGCILTACAKHSSQCKKIILENNGLQIAKNLHLRGLETELLP